MVTMAKYLAPFLFVALLAISTQIYAGTLPKHVPFKVSAQISGSNDYDCLSRDRTRLRKFFTDAFMDQMCLPSSSEDNELLSQIITFFEITVIHYLMVPTVDLMELERDLYRRMDKPYPSTQHKAEPKARKEYRMLSDEERQRFHYAINTLKNTSVGDSNYYDSLSDFHLSSISPGAHFGPAFLGWHKQYLLRMESALQAIDSSVTIPYWDSTLESRLEGQASYSIMWSDDFLGNWKGPVETGPFANWRMPRPVEGRDYLWRGNGSGEQLMTDEGYDYVMNISDFRELTFFVDPFFELTHGDSHRWVGGAMGIIDYSPFDPIFFMHHAFIDYMWDAQRAIVYENQGREGYVYPSSDDEEAYGVGEIDDALAENPTILESAEDSPHYPDKQMLPFDLLNKDSLDEIHMTTYYYAPRPSCSAADPDCGSAYLFCIEEIYKCAPKLTTGADCKNFKASNSCFEGDCINGFCRDK